MQAFERDTASLRWALAASYYPHMPEESSRSRPSLKIVAVLIIACSVAGWLTFGDITSAQRIARCLVLGEGRFVGSVPEGEFAVDYFGERYIGTADNLIDWYVYVFGAWEGPMLAAMEDLLRLTDGDDGVVLDIGANVGTHSIYLSNYAARVHAVEPWPTVLDRMKRMLDASDITNVEIHPVGFSETAGTLPFYVPPDENLGSGSFSASIVGDRAGGELVELPLVVGDRYLEEQNIAEIDIVKIDIEGYEKGALRGLHAMLVRDRPTVFLELNVGNEEGFHSEDELRSVFPDDYQFWELLEPERFIWQVGERGVVACGDDDRSYALVPYDMSFENAGVTLVAIPVSLGARLGELPGRATLQ